MAEDRFIYTIHGERDVSWYGMTRDIDPALRKNAANNMHSATFGWTSDFKSAEDIVLTNACDIHETCFTYMVIEKYPEGIYMKPLEEYWYRWIHTGLGHDAGHYERCDKPYGLENIISFGLS